LMHDGQWTYEDLLLLIELAQKKVQEQFWILLEPEVQIILP
jgi:UDP-N-acetylenolpyruvoylglucosamine reductase